MRKKGNWFLYYIKTVEDNIKWKCKIIILQKFKTQYINQQYHISIKMHTIFLKKYKRKQVNK